MPDKITTLKLIDNTDVFPNIKDENIPNTIMRVADLSKYLNQLKSINIAGDIGSTTITSDIATFTTANISTLNVSGISQFEGEATFGHNVHVDGNLVVNGIDNIVDKEGGKIIEFEIIREDILARVANFANNAETSKSVRYAFSWLPYSDLHINDILPIYTLYYGWPGANGLNGNFLFNSCHHLKELPYNIVIDSIIEKCSSLIECFGTCDALETIGEYNMANAISLEKIFINCGSLKHIHMKNIPVNLDISASTRFEEADLVEIIGNLMDLTGKPSQTLTMGATNLAKLTDEEKAVAINKNWVLA